MFTEKRQHCVEAAARPSICCMGHHVNELAGGVPDSSANKTAGYPRYRQAQVKVLAEPSCRQQAQSTQSKAR